ncbi:cellobiose phosphorylase [Legionella gratiana]|uniref:Cellobiose phosphorylase n=1 Tax=Legionella gratiana TaxID=45066 RepID=A0A378J3P9_9GAMM|nr:ChbG/HpnK family deacetylase [Legionella gratiana]KTD14552.1 cellobiose phosphorylase [Legionella gratiana]STX41868.1 cellobiose phosphorylase [Legionella gratiana]
MIKSKTVVLCADDFGLNSGVSEGILKLVCKKRLSAVSCMTNMPDFISYGQQLLFLKDQIKIGLHFNLTEGHLLFCPERKCFSLSELLIKSYMHSVKLSFIAQEFLAQLQQFTKIMHQLPDFIDGHQHVHQLPVIRKVMLDLYERRLKNNGTSIRSTWPSINLPQYGLKAKVLRFTGGKALTQQLIKFNIPHNRYFSGIYDFASDANYRDLFRKWLRLAEENTLIMCHPGESINTADSIAHARLNELNYFLSDAFLTDCNEHGVQLAHQY